MCGLRPVPLVQSVQDPWREPCERFRLSPKALKALWSSGPGSNRSRGSLDGTRLARETTGAFRLVWLGAWDHLGALHFRGRMFPRWRVSEAACAWTECVRAE